LPAFGNAVPVAACSECAKSALDFCPRQLGTPLSIWKVDVSFAANQVHLVRAGLNGLGLLARLLARIVSQKVDQQFAGLNAFASGKRVFGDHALQVGKRPENHAGPKAEFLFQSLLNALCKLRHIFFIRAKDHVSALDKSLRGLEFEREAKLLELVHFDFVASAHVNPAEHADDDWHGASIRQ